MNEIAITASVKAGFITAVITYLMADTGMTIVVMAAFSGAVLGWVKAVLHLDKKTTFLKATSELLIMIFVSVSLAVISAEVGNNIYPMDFGWIVIGGLIGAHAKGIQDVLESILKQLLEASVQMIIKVIDGASDIILNILNRWK